MADYRAVSEAVRIAEGKSGLIREVMASRAAGRIVKVRGRPKDYLACVEREDFGRITVRPLPGQEMTTRARSIWRTAIIKEMERHQ
jgi:hypothetical protein